MLKIHSFPEREGIRECWVTYSYDEGFLPGVIALKSSLDLERSEYPLLCMIGPEVSSRGEELLQQKGVMTQRFEEDEVVRVDGRFIDRYAARPELMFSKLNLFRFLGMDRIVYVDADMICLRNCDELFKKTNISMVALSKKRMSADFFSAGLISVSPSKDFLVAINEALTSSKLAGNTDQTLLNQLFANQIYKLPRRYNYHYKDLGIMRLRKLTLSFHFNILKSLNSISMFHYDGQKPWIEHGQMEGLRWKEGRNAPYKTWHRIHTS